MDSFRMKSIYFGNKRQDADVASICYPDDSKYQYQIQGDNPSLAGSSVTLNLTVPGTTGKPDLQLNIAVVHDAVSNDKGAFLQFDWNYKNLLQPGVKKPFRVPKTVVNTSVLVPCATCKLSDFIALKAGSDGPLVKVKSQKSQGQDVFRIQDLIFGEFRNDILMQLVTDKDLKPHRGNIIGLNDGVTDQLVQPDQGIHAFWNRDNPDPVDTGELPAANDYSTHPFFAYTASDGTVYGVFVNTANA